MPYPHVIQFETVDRRRHRFLGTAEAPTRRAVRPGRRRSGLPRVWRLNRTRRCAEGAV